MPGEKRKAANTADIATFFKRQAISSRESEVSEVAVVDKTATPKSQRQSGIDDKWKKDFPWLQETSDGKGMLCTVCIKHQCRPKKCPAGRAVWVDVPCTSIRRYSCTTHMEADNHKDALLRDAAEALTGGGIQACFTREKAVNREALEASLTLLYLLCKEEVPHHGMFIPLLQTVKHLGLGVLQSLEKGGNAKYTSNRHIHEVTLLFGEVIWEEIRQEILESPAYSVMVDETTDISTNSQLIVYLRYLKGGESKTVFATIVHVPNGKADTITSAILAFLNENHIPLQKMVAFGSDGAAVMVGRKNGVGTQLQHKIPHLLMNHCVAHRLALASAQAATNVPYLQKFKKIIEQLFHFYQHSGVRTATLKEIQTVLNIPTLKLKEAKDVRWLSHDQACRAVRLSLTAVVTSLEYEATEKCDAVAQGLSVFIQRYEFVAALHMMCDVLPVLSSLSRAFQSKDCAYSQVGNHVAGTIATIKALKQVPGEHFRSMTQVMKDLAGQPYKFREPLETDVQNFQKNVYDKFLDSVVSNLEKRFPNIVELEAFSAFDPTQWPEDQELLDDHGTGEIQMLATRFDINKDQALAELRILKQTVLNHSDTGLKKQSAKCIMEMVTKNMSEALPSLTKLAAVGLLIPSSTADCERGFSALNRLKTQHRNRLGQDTLQSLMLCVIEGHEVTKFPYQKVVDLWKGAGNRRLCV